MNYLNKLGIKTKEDLQLAFKSDSYLIGNLFISDYFIETDSIEKTRIGRGSICIDEKNKSLTWFSFAPFVKDLFEENSYLDTGYLDLDVLAYTKTMLGVSKTLPDLQDYTISRIRDDESSPQRIHRINSMGLDIEKELLFKSHLNKSLEYALTNNSY